MVVGKRSTMRPCCIEEVIFVTEHQFEEPTYKAGNWRPQRSSETRIRCTSTNNLVPLKVDHSVKIDTSAGSPSRSVRRVRFQLPSPDGQSSVIVGGRVSAVASADFKSSPTPTATGETQHLLRKSLVTFYDGASCGRDRSKTPSRCSRRTLPPEQIRNNTFCTASKSTSKSARNSNSGVVSVTASPGYRKRCYPTGSYSKGTLSPDTVNGSSPHHAASPLGGATLLQAARDGDERLVKELLRKAILVGIMESDLNAVDSSGRTALSYVASNGSLEILELILQLPGLNINKADNEGNTPLHFAAQAGQVECLNCLLNRCQGIEIDARNNLGFTPLMKAALQGRNKCAKLLLLAKANPTLRDNGRGFRADEWARFCGRYVCADVIEKYAKQRLLERSTSSGNWGRDNKLGARVIMGKVVPVPTITPPPSNGFKSKLKKVFRTSSEQRRHQENAYSSAKLVTHLTSAALCASSPILPSAPTMPPVVRSLIRPLTVPKLQITLANNNNDCPYSNLNGVVTKIAPHAEPEDITPILKPARMKKKK